MNCHPERSEGPAFHATGEPRKSEVPFSLRPAACLLPPVTCLSRHLTHAPVQDIIRKSKTVRRLEEATPVGFIRSYWVPGFLSSDRKEESMRSVLTLGLVAILCIVASAQLPTSTVNGTVTDPQGAPVANAKVSIVSQATGAVRDTTTDSAGFYSVTNLLPADYTLRVETPTVAKAEIKNVRLEVGRASTVDVKFGISQ